MYAYDNITEEQQKLFIQMGASRLYSDVGDCTSINIEH